MLVSFHLASKYPENLAALFDNLETANDPCCFEVLVKADTEDLATRAFLETEARRRKFRLVPLITPRRRGYEDLWEALNELHRMTDPTAYFVCNINDEVRIHPAGWDDCLKQYVGLFPDHIFRLRTSKLKFRNYYDLWECGFAPENYAFFTKRWLDICGDWGPCFGPDSSQQYIAYYLGYGNYPSIKQYNRDIPILDIGWQNEGVGRNIVDEEARRRRTATNLRLWARQVSHPMQQELYRRARLLQAHIMQASIASSHRIHIVDDRRRRTILLRDMTDGVLLDLLPYRISRIQLRLQNLHRYLRYTYFAGGGRESRNVLPISIYEFLFHRYLGLQRIVGAISGRIPRYKGRSPDLQPVLTLMSRWKRKCYSELGRVARSISGWRKNRHVGSQYAARPTSWWKKYRDLGLLPIARSISQWKNRSRRRPRSGRGEAHFFERWQVIRLRLQEHPIGRLLFRIGSPVARRVIPINRSISLRCAYLMRHLTVAHSKACGHVADAASRLRANSIAVKSSILAALARAASSIWQGIARSLASVSASIAGAVSLAATTIRKIIRGLKRIVFIALYAVATVTNPWVWRGWGRRISLAIMDRDWRWFTIKEIHRGRIAPLHDPWFDPYEKKKDAAKLDAAPSNTPTPDESRASAN